MKKITGFGLSFAVFIFFLNLIGCYDFVMVMTRNQTYFAEHYNSAIMVYFSHYPVVFVIVWFSHLLAATLSPIFYFFRRKLALTLAGLAFWGIMENHHSNFCNSCIWNCRIFGNFHHKRWACFHTSNRDANLSDQPYPCLAQSL